MPQKDRITVYTTLGLSVAIITLVTVLVVVMFLRQAALVRNADAWISHSHEVTENIETLLSRIKDAALYQHNYAISGNVEFLKKYNGVIASSGPGQKTHTIEDDIDSLQLLTNDNPVQQKNAGDLKKSVGDLRTYLDEMIVLQQKNSPEASSNANALRGMHLLNNVRNVTAAMLSEEMRLLTQRRALDEATSRHNTQFVLGAISFFYLIKLFLMVLMFSQWRRAKNLEQQQDEKNKEVAAANQKLHVLNHELEALNKQIRESGQIRLRAIVDNAIDGLITINAGGLVESYNRACEKIFGYSLDEVADKNINMLMPEPYHSEHDKYIQHYRSTGEKKIIGIGREVFGKRKDGSVFPMELSVSSFFLDGEEHFSGIVRDITARKQAEAELLRYTKELEHSNQELDDFAYIASHDLKEPLRGLFNHASFLLEDYKDKLDEEGIRRLKRLSQLSQRMENLVNDLLYFSRLGRSDLAIQNTDPNQVVREIEQMMEAFLKDHRARIAVPTPMPPMVCDKPRITEVFRNLITNGVKYNNKPDPVVEVGFLNAANAPHGVENNVFYVKDNGIGIEPEFHQEIFRIFKRLNKSDSDEGGTGVGLTFVKKIVERHHGHIWLESKPETGTTFYFNLGQEKAA